MSFVSQSITWTTLYLIDVVCVPVDYLDYAERYTVPHVKILRQHLMKLLYRYISRHEQLREGIMDSNTLPEFREVCRLCAQLRDCGGGEQAYPISWYQRYRLELEEVQDPNNLSEMYHHHHHHHHQQQQQQQQKPEQLQLPNSGNNSNSECSEVSRVEESTGMRRQEGLIGTIIDIPDTSDQTSGGEIGAPISSNHLKRYRRYMVVRKKSSAAAGSDGEAIAPPSYKVHSFLNTLTDWEGESQQRDGVGKGALASSTDVARGDSGDDDDAAASMDDFGVFGSMFS